MCLCTSTFENIIKSNVYKIHQVRVIHNDNLKLSHSIIYDSYGTIEFIIFF